MPLHVVQRGNNRAACFVDDEDRQAYLASLIEYAPESACAVHAYVLMGNHVHLLLTPAKAEGASTLMQCVGRRYVRRYNDRHDRSGTIWEGRFRSAPVHSQRYLVACMRYIELNPVRAGLVPHPAAYAWSSYRANALGVEDPIVQPHAVWYALGRSAGERRDAYRSLFAGQTDESVLRHFRMTKQRGRPPKARSAAVEKRGLTPFS